MRQLDLRKMLFVILDMNQLEALSYCYGHLVWFVKLGHWRFYVRKLKMAIAIHIRRHALREANFTEPYLMKLRKTFRMC